MAHAFTPGLTVTADTLVRLSRRLPLDGEVLVEPGQPVEPDSPVARTALPGPVRLVNMAAGLGVAPGNVTDHLLVRIGAAVDQGTLLASRRSLFGLLRSEVRSPVRGTVESLSDVTGQAVLREPPRPITVTAHIRGRVVELEPRRGVIVETRGALLQGIFGIGGETHGKLRRAVPRADSPLEASCISEEMSGSVVVGGSRLTLEGFQAAVRRGVAAIVTGSIDDADLRAILGHDLGVAITGQEQVGATVIVTEGFGALAMNQATFTLLGRLAGREASVNGATQIRAGVIRPQVVVPHEPTQGDATPPPPDFEMVVGTGVRLIREPWFGRMGRVTALPAAPHPLETEACVRVVEVRLDDGEAVVVPRANVEVLATSGR